MIERVVRDALYSLSCFFDLALSKKGRGYHPVRPFRARVQPNKIHRPLSSSKFQKAPSTRAKSVIARIQCQRGVTFARGFFQHAGIAENIRKSKMRFPSTDRRRRGSWAVWRYRESRRLHPVLVAVLAGPGWLVVPVGKAGLVWWRSAYCATVVGYY